MNHARLIVFDLLILLAQLLWSAPAVSQYALSDAGYDGFVMPAEDILVAALESGRLEHLLVKVGDRVEAGQMIAKLDDAIQLFAVESAAAIASMQGALDAASADKNIHELRLKQLRDLASKGVARPEELSRAEAEFQVAEARWLAAKEDVLVRNIDLKRAREQLRRRQIITPISGIVAKILTKPGEFVSPSDPSVVQIIDVTTLIGEFNIPAAEALRFQTSQSVKISALSLATAVTGFVETIAPLIDGESGTLAVKVRIDNSDGKLLPGDRCMMEAGEKAVRISERPTSHEFFNPLRAPVEAAKR
jgi:RND family efflux transporter MFP subunit